MEFNHLMLIKLMGLDYYNIDVHFKILINKIKKIIKYNLWMDGWADGCTF